MFKRTVGIEFRRGNQREKGFLLEFKKVEIKFLYFQCMELSEWVDNT